MHIPDGFINGVTSAGALVASAGGLGAALRVGSRSLKDRQIPMAGLAAAFIFVLQMLNFPVAAGTSGHLLGGALAAILLGPALGITVVSVVVIVQALLFADGGMSALGLNVLNMAVVTAAVAWLVFRGLMLVLPKKTPSVLFATMVAGWASVVASSLAFSVQYAIGGQGGVDPQVVTGAMVGVHALIGIGEGIITAMVIGAVLAVRPDLVTGLRAGGIEIDRSSAGPNRVSTGVFVVAGLVAAVALVMFVAPLASSSPDGLERVAEDTGFAVTAEESAVGGPLADYGAGLAVDERVGTVVAGAVGIVVTFAIGFLAFAVLRRRKGHRHSESQA